MIKGILSAVFIFCPIIIQFFGGNFDGNTFLSIILVLVILYSIYLVALNFIGRGIYPVNSTHQSFWIRLKIGNYEIIHLGSLILGILFGIAFLPGYALNTTLYNIYIILFSLFYITNFRMKNRRIT